MLKLLAIEDAHPTSFDAYAQALSQLAELGHLARGRATAPVLRQFEWVLLREIGYGLLGPMPDFADSSQAAQLKTMLQDLILEHVPGSALSSRQVLLSLRRLTNPPEPHDL